MATTAEDRHASPEATLSSHAGTVVQSDGPRASVSATTTATPALAQRLGAGRERRAGRPDVVDEERLTGAVGAVQTAGGSASRSERLRPT